MHSTLSFLHSRLTKSLPFGRSGGASIAAILLPILLLFVFSLPTAAKGNGKHLKLRLMSYNVRHLEGMDGIASAERIASVIASAHPDAVALQELDSVNGRTLYADQLRQLAWLTGMHPVWATAISFAGGGYGVGMLTREKPVSVRRIPLPGSEPRMLLIVETEKYVYACTHLDLTEQARLASVEIISREAAKSGKPFFIAGDLNAEPDSKVIGAFESNFQILNDTTAKTFPAPKPTECIDYIMVRKGIGMAKVRRSTVVDDPLSSDHRPLTVDLTMRWK